MATSAWTPVDETPSAASAWTPVPESKPAAASEKEGFWHSLGAVFGITPEAMEAGRKRYEAAGGDIHAAAKIALQDSLPHPIEMAKSAGSAVANEFSKGSQEGQMAADAMKRGDIKGALAHSVGQAGHAGATLLAPVFGENLSKSGEQIGQGDVAGGLGTATGVLAPVVAGAAIPGKAPAGNVGLAEKMYQSALKPPLRMGPEGVANVVRTGLEQGIPVSEAGAVKLDGLIKDLQGKIKQQIGQGAATGQVVDPEAVASRLDQVASRFANQVTPESDLSAINATKAEFLKRYGAVDDSGQFAYRSRDVGEKGIPSASRSQAGLDPQQIKGYMPSRARVTGNPQELVKVDLTKFNPADYTLMKDPQGGPSWVKFNKDIPESSVQPTKIPVDQAQAMKQGTYQQLKGRAYGELKSATIESQKALARGLKEELEAQFPEIKGLNAQEGQFFNLQGTIEKALARIGNHQLIGIGTPIMAGAGGAVGGAPAAGAAGVLKLVLDNPTVKSRLAIAINKAGRGAIPLTSANARVLAYSNALAQGASAGASGSSPSQ
jgi:hypothetical protein